MVLWNGTQPGARAVAVMSARWAAGIGTVGLLAAIALPVAFAQTVPATPASPPSASRPAAAASPAPAAPARKRSGFGAAMANLTDALREASREQPPAAATQAGAGPQAAPEAGSSNPLDATATLAAQPTP